MKSILMIAAFAVVGWVIGWYWPEIHGIITNTCPGM